MLRRIPPPATLLAWRRTRSLRTATAVVLLGALTPWLYELGRVAYETVLEPLVIALVLLSLDWAYRSSRPLPLRALLPGLALGALTYVYAAGRLLAPLYVRSSRSPSTGTTTRAR